MYDESQNMATGQYHKWNKLSKVIYSVKLTEDYAVSPLHIHQM